MFRVVQWSAIALFAATLLMFILVVLMRVRLEMRERRRRKFLAVWEPILMRSVDVAFSDVPHLRRGDLMNFLLLWNHLHESLLDEAKDHLNQIARALCIGDAALRMLRRRNLRERLLAIMTLGQLRERAAWDSLFEIAESGGALPSVAAARGLVMIDAVTAVPLVMPLLIRRDDWPAARVATLLQTAGADVISDQIAAAAIAYTKEHDTEDRSAAPQGQTINHSARLIRYLELAYTVSSEPAVRTIADSCRDPEVLAACLQLLKSAEDLPIARHSLTHKDWRVRVQAASAMGRIGESDDERLLVPLLSDEQWWVRYRAAQALTRLPSMREPRLKEIQAVQVDPFARDILTQAMAEVQLQ
jgi:HEAT repeat protein